MSIHSRKGAESGQRRTPCKSLYKIRLFLGCGIEKRTGRNWLYKSQFRLHLSRKIIRILRRIATVPVLFVCHSLRTAHRIQKTCRRFLAVRPRGFFCVLIPTIKVTIPSTLLEDIATPLLRRWLRGASLSQLNLYQFIFPAS